MLLVQKKKSKVHMKMKKLEHNSAFKPRVFLAQMCPSQQKRRGSMYLEEETNKRSEVISCIFSLKEEVGALAKALRLFEVNLTFPPTAHKHAVTPSLSAGSPYASPDLQMISGKFPCSATPWLSGAVTSPRLGIKLGGKKKKNVVSHH